MHKIQWLTLKSGTLFVLWSFCNLTFLLYLYYVYLKKIICTAYYNGLLIDLFRLLTSDDPEDRHLPLFWFLIVMMYINVGRACTVRIGLGSGSRERPGRGGRWQRGSSWITRETSGRAPREARNPPDSATRLRARRGEKLLCRPGCRRRWRHPSDPPVCSTAWALGKSALPTGQPRASALPREPFTRSATSLFCAFLNFWSINQQLDTQVFSAWRGARCWV